MSDLSDYDSLKGEVNEVLVKYFGLDEEFRFDFRQPIREQVDEGEFESWDLAQIFQRILRHKYIDYFCGGRLGRRVRDRFLVLEAIEREGTVFEEKLERRLMDPSSNIEVSEVLRYITPGHLTRIVEYDRIGYVPTRGKTK
jgi:hypothetical protein